MSQRLVFITGLFLGFLAVSVVVFCHLVEDNDRVVINQTLIYKAKPNPLPANIKQHQSVSETASIKIKHNTKISDQYELIEKLDRTMKIEGLNERSKEVYRLLAYAEAHNIMQIIDWLSTQEQTTEVGEYYFPLLQKLAKYNHEAAGDVILSLTNFDAKASIVSDYAHNLAVTEPLKTIAWLDNINETDIRDFAKIEVFNVWFDNNLEQALDVLYLDSTVNFAIKNQIISKAASKICKQDPLLTAELISQFSYRLQPEIAYSVISFWPQDKLDQAIAWINTLANVKNKDRAITSYIDSTGIRQNLRESLLLTEGVNNVELRNQLQSRLIYSWYQQEPLAATQYAKQSTDFSTFQLADMLNN